MSLNMFKFKFMIDSSIIACVMRTSCSATRVFDLGVVLRLQVAGSTEQAMYGDQLSRMHFPMNSSTCAPPGLRVGKHLVSTGQQQAYSLPVEYVADKTDADVEPLSSSDRRRYLTRSYLQKCENAASCVGCCCADHNGQSRNRLNGASLRLSKDPKRKDPKEGSQ